VSEALNPNLKVALVGTPNAGKTALFNVLTASHQRVANYAGVTVDSVEADFKLPNGSTATLIDLPGAYSLRPYTDDEGILADALGHDELGAMVIVVDATQPERAIRFLLEVLDHTDRPAVVAFNMSDIAKERGSLFDFAVLEKELGVPIVPTVAVKKKGIPELRAALERAVAEQRRKKDAFFGEKKASPTRAEISSEILSFYKKADTILKGALTRKGNPDYQSEKFDRWVLHPVWGFLILTAVLGVTFQLMFNLAEYPMHAIETLFEWIGNWIKHFGFIPVGVKSFLVDGMLAGVGGTIVFLPQILILFSLILFLEDFGFMARAVFLLDHWMGKVGLHGRAFLPLLSSYACAVPGILSVKTIESRRDRIVTTMIIPLMTCSARIPVYTLLISAFIPNREVVWGIRLQGLVMLALYAVGTIFAFLMGAIFRRFLLKGNRPPLLIELPSYKWPSVSSVIRGLIYRAQLFIRRVGTIILGLSMVIWFMVSFPKAPEGTAHPIEYSYAASVGHFFEPVLKPIGFDWKIGMALVPTFAAREVMVSALSTVYAVDDSDDTKKTEKLSSVIKGEWSLATGLSLLVWVIFAPQCISTLATARRELQSTKWMILMVVYLFALAYLASWITFRLAS